jgi:hypothetical protein
MVKFLVTFGSVCTIGFGAWHFFVPMLWDWYSYIDPKATELVVAVRAINVFFSLSLVLFGVANLLFVYFSATRFPLIVMLALTSVLWAVRCLFQIIHPQGSASAILQYGMLSAFIIIFLCYLVSLLMVAIKTSASGPF